jgi:hypothetical protein
MAYRGFSIAKVYRTVSNVPSFDVVRDETRIGTYASEDFAMSAIDIIKREQAKTPMQKGICDYYERE